MPLTALTRGALLHVGTRALTLGLGLALMVVIARLGPAVQGAFALFVAIESLLLNAGSGLGLWLARAVSGAAPAPARVARRVLGFALLAGAVLALPLFVSGALSAREPYRHLGLLAAAAPLLLLTPTASGLWLGQGRMLALGAPAVAAPALALAALAALWWSRDAPPDVGAVLLAWVVAKAVVGLVAGTIAWRTAAQIASTPFEGPLGGQANDGRHALRFVALVGLGNLVSLLNLRATLFLLERSHGVSAAGVYSVAVQIAELLWVLSSAYATAAYHRLGAGDPSVAARVTLGALRAGVGVVLVVAPLLAIVAWWALPRWLGAEYAEARVPLLVLLPGVVAYAAASSLSAYHTNRLGRPQWAAGVAALSLALTLAIAAFTVPRWGATGAALATTLAYGAAIVFALRGFLRDRGWRWREVVRGVDAPPTAQSRPT
ncbi:MAG: polysaccharide biosynthesis C-terminal domain-containing protein [Rubrivivax sp.]